MIIRRLRQREGEENPCFLRDETVARDRIGGQIDISVLERDSAGYPRAAHDRDIAILKRANPIDPRLAIDASARTGDDDSLGDRRQIVENARIGIDMEISDRYGGQLRNIRNIELGIGRMLLQGAGIEECLMVPHITEAAEVPFIEGIGLEGIYLLYISAAIDPFCKHNHDPLSLSLRVRRQRDGLEQIQRPISANRGRWAHRAGNNDRFIRLHDQIQEIGSFIQCIRAMGNDEAMHIGSQCHFIDDGRQSQPVLTGNIGAAQIADLNAQTIGNFIQVRHTVQQMLNRQRAGLIVQGFMRFTAARNRPAGG